MKNKTPWWRQLIDAFKDGYKNAKPAADKTPPPALPVKPAKSERYVYITKTGKKYHYGADCPALQDAWARDEVIKVGLSKAHAAGLQPCSKCGYTWHE